MKKLHFVTLALALGLLMGLTTGATVSAALRQAQDAAYPGKKIQLPSINVEDGWSTWIHAQNVGDDDTGAVVFFWVYIPLVIKEHRLEPTVSNLHMSSAPYGPPVTQFPAGTTVVYAVFSYFYMQGDEVRVTVHDQVGSILLEQVETYTGSGMESIEVSGPGGEALADGWYVTDVYANSSLFPIETIYWDVGSW